VRSDLAGLRFQMIERQMRHIPLRIPVTTGLLVHHGSGTTLDCI
jgi:hypothetical protein